MKPLNDGLPPLSAATASTGALTRAYGAGITAAVTAGKLPASVRQTSTAQASKAGKGGDTAAATAQKQGGSSIKSRSVATARRQQSPMDRDNGRQDVSQAETDLAPPDHGQAPDPQDQHVQSGHDQGGSGSHLVRQRLYQAMRAHGESGPLPDMLSDNAVLGAVSGEVLDCVQATAVVGLAAGGSCAGDATGTSGNRHRPNSGAETSSSDCAAGQRRPMGRSISQPLAHVQQIRTMQQQQGQNLNDTGKWKGQVTTPAFLDSRSGAAAAGVGAGAARVDPRQQHQKPYFSYQSVSAPGSPRSSSYWQLIPRPYSGVPNPAQLAVALRNSGLSAHSASAPELEAGAVALASPTDASGNRNTIRPAGGSGGNSKSGDALGIPPPPPHLQSDGSGDAKDSTTISDGGRRPAQDCRALPAVLDDDGSGAIGTILNTLQRMLVDSPRTSASLEAAQPQQKAQSPAPLSQSDRLRACASALREAGEAIPHHPMLVQLLGLVAIELVTASDTILVVTGGKLPQQQQQQQHHHLQPSYELQRPQQPAQHPSAAASPQFPHTGGISSIATGPGSCNSSMMMSAASLGLSATATTNSPGLGPDSAVDGALVVVVQAAGPDPLSQQHHQDGDTNGNRAGARHTSGSREAIAMPLQRVSSGGAASFLEFDSNAGGALSSAAQQLHYNNVSTVTEAPTPQSTDSVSEATSKSFSASPSSRERPSGRGSSSREETPRPTVTVDFNNTGSTIATTHMQSNKAITATCSAADGQGTDDNGYEGYEPAAAEVVTTLTATAAAAGPTDQHHHLHLHHHHHHHHQQQAQNQLEQQQHSYDYAETAVPAGVGFFEYDDGDSMDGFSEYANDDEDGEDGDSVAEYEHEERHHQHAGREQSNYSARPSRRSRFDGIRLEVLPSGHTHPASSSVSSRGGRNGPASSSGASFVPKLSLYSPSSQSHSQASRGPGGTLHAAAMSFHEEFLTTMMSEQGMSETWRAEMCDMPTMGKG